jgi:very-short-patch-repair endonuclease
MPLSLEMAAVLACGGGAMLSHATAAHAWGFRPPPEDGFVDVMVTGSNRRARDSIRVHRIAELDPRDRRRYQNIPITSPARALLDVAPTLSGRELELAFDEAIVRKLVTVRSVRAVLARYPCRRGSASLAVLADDSRPTTLTRSRGEEMLHELLRKARLPQPEVNARWRSYLIDFLWREQRVAIEVDGLKFHSTRAVLERDHRRDADLKDAGFEVIRITWRMLVDDRELVLVRLARALSRAQ